MWRIAWLLFFLPASASADVYRWVDANGTVHYSNEAPPPGVRATKLPIEAKAGPPSADSQECYSVRCQGERMEERIARREEADTREAAQRAATAPPRPQGSTFASTFQSSAG